MPVNVLFAAAPARWEEYREPLARALSEAGVDARLATDLPPETVDYVVYAPNGPLRDFSPFARLKAVLSLWAGVETITGKVPADVPLARMVDPDLTQGMVEYVTGHVLRHHLGMDAQIRRTRAEWRVAVPPLARDRPVTILGLGELGRACAAALSGLGFPVAGWSRTPRAVPGVSCRHGPDGLVQALASAQILVLLLPDTPATRDILNATTLAQLPKGAVVLNPGRGALIDDVALIAALDAGQIGHATLDTFKVEPLPLDHPYWTHPRVTITPHIASETRADSAARQIAENVRRGEAGLPCLHLVDRAAGY